MSWAGYLLIGGLVALLIGGLVFTLRRNDGSDEQ